jgi:hypothetical protein
MIYELVILSEKIEIEKLAIAYGFVINKENGEVVGQVFTY